MKEFNKPARILELFSGQVESPGGYFVYPPRLLGPQAALGGKARQHQPRTIPRIPSLDLSTREECNL